MADIKEEHPADTVNMALLRANSLLASLAFCFDNGGGDFAVDKRFVAQSIEATMRLVEQASSALLRLNEECDLTLIADRSEMSVTDADGAERNDLDFATVMQMTRDSAAPSSFPDQSNSQHAQTYEQLLQKVTAAEVFAAAQANSSERGESMLIPILNSLKQDLMRMKSVA